MLTVRYEVVFRWAQFALELVFRLLVHLVFVCSYANPTRYQNLKTNKKICCVTDKDYWLHTKNLISIIFFVHSLLLSYILNSASKVHVDIAIWQHERIYLELNFTLHTLIFSGLKSARIFFFHRYNFSRKWTCTQNVLIDIKLVTSNMLNVHVKSMRKYSKEARK